MNFIAVRLMQIIFFCLGLAPCKIEIKSSNCLKKSIHFSYSIWGSAYNILLATISSVIAITIVPNQSKDYDFPYSKIVVAMDMTASLMANLFVVVIAIIYCIFQKNIIKIGNQLSDFRCNLWHPPKILAILKYFKVFLIVIIWIGCIVDLSLPAKVFVLLSSMAPAIILSAFLLQYTLLIDILNDKFRGINECLHGDVFPIDQWILQKFITIRKSRYGLYKIACQISEFYEFPVLIVIFHCCCNCISVLYFSIVNFTYRDKTAASCTSPYHLVLSGFWLAVYGYPVVIMCTSIKRLNTEMNRTGDIIYDIRLANFMNKAVVDEVNNFAIELGHTKVEFTAFGLFSLDCTLLHSIFGMTVTYLMILLQFEPPSDATG